MDVASEHHAGLSLLSLRSCELYENCSVVTPNTEEMHLPRDGQGTQPAPCFGQWPARHAFMAKEQVAKQPARHGSGHRATGMAAGQARQSAALPKAGGGGWRALVV